MIPRAEPVRARRPEAAGGRGGTASARVAWLARCLFWLGLALGASRALGDGPGADSPSLDRLQTAFAEGRFVAYTPRSFAVVGGGVRPADPQGVLDDLRRLRRWFDGLITYSSVAGHEHIAAAARALGYRALVPGVWDPADPVELDAAVRVARAFPDLVVGIAVGNEGLFWRRYEPPALEAGLGRLRGELPGLPLTTSEPFALYLGGAHEALMRSLDFLLPNVHPTFEVWFDPRRPEQAVEFVASVTDLLVERFGKPVLVKETGLPSAPAERGFSEVRQARFWSLLAAHLPPSRARAVAWFEAFDAPWKPASQALDSLRVEPEEAHWGLLDPSGRPKPALEGLAPLTAPSAGGP